MSNELCPNFWPKLAISDWSIVLWNIEKFNVYFLLQINSYTTLEKCMTFNEKFLWCRRNCFHTFLGISNTSLSRAQHFDTTKECYFKMHGFCWNFMGMCSYKWWMKYSEQSHTKVTILHIHPWYQTFMWNNILKWCWYIDAHDQAIKRIIGHPNITHQDRIFAPVGCLDT